MAFTSEDKDWNEFGRKNDQTRPGVAFKALPDEHLIVINDWVFDFILQHSVPYFIGALLVFKLCTMTANKYN